MGIAVPKSRIYTVSPDDCALSVIREMHTKVYTHVPVIENGQFVGVFSENSVVSYLAANEIVGLDQTIKIREFDAFIPVHSHNSETFVFFPRDASLFQIVSHFRQSLRERKRLGAVFLTQSGKHTEDILGLITAWDIAGSDPMNSPEWF